MPEIITQLAKPPQSETVSPFDVIESCELALSALNSLNLLRNQDQATISEVIQRNFQALHGSLMDRHPNRPVEPFISIKLTDTFGLGSLMSAFNIHKKGSGHIDHAVWDKYSATELNNRFTKPNSAQLQQKSLLRPRVMLQGNGDTVDEPGLYLRGEWFETQSSAVAWSQLMNPADYIVMQAQRREAGKTLMDAHTYTRFPQLERHSTWIPTADANTGQVVLDPCDDGIANPRAGVRLTFG